MRAGRPFATLFPEAGQAAVLVVVGERHRDAALALDPATPMGAAVHEARRYPDGTWVYARPGSSADVADLCRLLAVKLPPTIRARVESGIR